MSREPFWKAVTGENTSSTSIFAWIAQVRLNLPSNKENLQIILGCNIASQCHRSEVSRSLVDPINLWLFACYAYISPGKTKMPICQEIDGSVRLRICRGISRSGSNKKLKEAWREPCRQSRLKVAMEDSLWTDYCFVLFRHMGLGQPSLQNLRVEATSSSEWIEQNDSSQEENKWRVVKSDTSLNMRFPSLYS